MAGIVMGYGVVLAVLCGAIQKIDPGLARASFVTGTVGGGLCVVWGTLALLGHKRRVGAILTLIGLAFAVLGQLVPAWSAVGGEKSGSLAASILLTFIMLLTVAMLMYLLHGERSPEFYATGTGQQGGAPPDGRGINDERDTRSPRATHSTVRR